jgi:hypothetical protein
MAAGLTSHFSIALICGIESENSARESLTMAKYEHGSMDVTEQEKTFEGFLRWSVRIIVASIAVLIFLAIFNS